MSLTSAGFDADRRSTVSPPPPCALIVSMRAAEKALLSRRARSGKMDAQSSAMQSTAAPRATPRQTKRRCTHRHGHDRWCADVTVVIGDLRRRRSARVTGLRQGEEEGAPAADESRLLENGGEPRARLHRVAPRVARLHPVRQPRRPPRRRSHVRHVPRGRSAQCRHEHDDARRDAVGRGALQQRLRAVQDAALRRELRLTARRAPADVAAPNRGGDATRRPPFWTPLRGGSWPARHRLRGFERCGQARGARQTRAREEPAAGPKVGTRLRHAGRTRPCVPGTQKTRLLAPHLSFPGTNDQRAITRHGARPATSSRHDRSPCTRAVRGVARRATERWRRSIRSGRNRAIRSSTRSRDRFLPASA